MVLGRDGALRRPRRVQRRNPVGFVKVRSARCDTGGDIAARCPYLPLTGHAQSIFKKCVAADVSRRKSNSGK